MSARSGQAHVTPPGGGGAAGEDAALVAGVQRPALVRGVQPLLAAEVQDGAVGTEDDAGDAAVAGQPAGAGGGDGGPGGGGGGAVPGGGVDQVVEVDAHDHVRLDLAQLRQLPGGQGVVAQLDQGVGVLLAAGALIAGAAAGLQVGFQRGRQLGPA